MRRPWRSCSFPGRPVRELLSVEETLRYSNLLHTLYRNSPVCGFTFPDKLLIDKLKVPFANTQFRRNGNSSRRVICCVPVEKIRVSQYFSHPLVIPGQDVRESANCAMDGAFGVVTYVFQKRNEKYLDTLISERGTQKITLRLLFPFLLNGRHSPNVTKCLNCYGKRVRCKNPS